MQFPLKMCFVLLENGKVTMKDILPPALAFSGLNSGRDTVGETSLHFTVKKKKKKL